MQISLGRSWKDIIPFEGRSRERPVKYARQCPHLPHTLAGPQHEEAKAIPEQREQNRQGAYVQS